MNNGGIPIDFTEVLVLFPALYLEIPPSKN